MIITVSREFGSGGRELGKRLSDALHIPCYDNEIIAIIASQQGFDENYVSRMSEKSIQQAYPMTIGHRFRTTGPNYATQQAIKIHVEQQRMIEGFAAQGDCIIIGRCADVILRNYKPFHIFVYADMAAKLQRCIERAPEDENLSQVELERKIRGIDKNRANHRSIYRLGARAAFYCYSIWVVAP